MKNSSRFYLSKVRDGRKMRFFYHEKCFSGDADPRTQANSTANKPSDKKHVIQESAPKQKGRGKWSTSSYGYQPRPG